MLQIIDVAKFNEHQLSKNWNSNKPALIRKFTSGLFGAHNKANTLLLYTAIVSIWDSTGAPKIFVPPWILVHRPIPLERRLLKPSCKLGKKSRVKLLPRNPHSQTFLGFYSLVIKKADCVTVHLLKKFQTKFKTKN